MIGSTHISKLINYTMLLRYYDSLLCTSKISKLYSYDKTNQASNDDSNKSGSNDNSNKSGCDNSKQGQLNHPSGVAVDSSGNIYVADTNNDRIAVFDSSGKLLKSIGSKGSNDDCKKSGSNDDSNKSGSNDNSNKSGCDNSKQGQLNHPSGVAVDSSGNIYVADTNNDRIAVFDSSGKLLKSIGSKGSNDDCKKSGSNDDSNKS